jgi:hypothetical protein
MPLTNLLLVNLLALAADADTEACGTTLSILTQDVGKSPETPIEKLSPEAFLARAESIMAVLHACSSDVVKRVPKDQAERLTLKLANYQSWMQAQVRPVLCTPEKWKGTALERRWYELQCREGGCPSCESPLRGPRKRWMIIKNPGSESGSSLYRLLSADQGLKGLPVELVEGASGGVHILADDVAGFVTPEVIDALSQGTVAEQGPPRTDVDKFAAILTNSTMAEFTALVQSSAYAFPATSRVLLRIAEAEDLRSGGQISGPIKLLQNDYVRISSQPESERIEQMAGKLAGSSTMKNIFMAKAASPGWRDYVFRVDVRGPRPTLNDVRLSDVNQAAGSLEFAQPNMRPDVMIRVDDIAKIKVVGQGGYE